MAFASRKGEPRLGRLSCAQLVSERYGVCFTSKYDKDRSDGNDPCQGGANGDTKGLLVWRKLTRLVMLRCAVKEQRWAKKVMGGTCDCLWRRVILGRESLDWYGVVIGGRGLPFVDDFSICDAITLLGFKNTRDMKWFLYSQGEFRIDSSRSATWKCEYSKDEFSVFRFLLFPTYKIVFASVFTSNFL